MMPETKFFGFIAMWFRKKNYIACKKDLHSIDEYQIKKWQVKTIWATEDELGLKEYKWATEEAEKAHTADTHKYPRRVTY